MSIRNKAAIVGIGETEFSKESGRTTLKMALEAITEALDDAGLVPEDVDGLVKMMANTDLSDIDILRSLNIPNLRFFSEIPHGGGGASGTVVHAAAAVAAGMADVVVTFRSLNQGLGIGGGRPQMNRWVEGPSQHRITAGLVTPAQWVSMFARRYLHEYKHTTEVLGRVSVLVRKHATTNPHAMMYNRPVTLEDHQQSRWIAKPLRMFDCCLRTAGGSAVVVTSAEKAKQLKSKHPPVYITGAAQGTGTLTESMTSYQRPSLSLLEEAEEAAREVYKVAEMEPKDIETAQIYDHFTPMVLMALEAYGFAERGKAPDLFREGRLELDGDMPLNTHGGQLGDGYLHGFSLMTEAVRQIRGTGANQPARQPKTALATAGTGVPTAALILSKDAS